MDERSEEQGDDESEGEEEGKGGGGWGDMGLGGVGGEVDGVAGGGLGGGGGLVMGGVVPSGAVGGCIYADGIPYSIGMYVYSGYLPDGVGDSYYGAVVVYCGLLMFYSELLVVSRRYFSRRPACAYAQGTRRDNYKS